jgi:hypothetical protein
MRGLLLKIALLQSRPLPYPSGYTGFTVRLDNITGLIYDDQQSNVIALRTDATFGSGHWYEGATAAEV